MQRPLLVSRSPASRPIATRPGRRRPRRRDRPGEQRPWPGALEHGKLLPEHKDLYDEAARGRKVAMSAHPRAETIASTAADHGPNRAARHERIAATDRVESVAQRCVFRHHNFRSCRDTGITWLALAGVPLQAIKSRAGHEVVETTLGYVKRPGRQGRPAVPAVAPRPRSSGQDWAKFRGTGQKPRENGAGGGNRTPDLARMKRPL